MINAIVIKELETRFSSLSVDTTDPVALTGWYALFNQMSKDVNPKSEGSIAMYFASASFVNFLHSNHLTMFIPKDLFPKTSQIYGLYKLLSVSNLLLDHVSFFDAFCPNLVADWYSFEKLFPRNRVHMLICLHAIVVVSGDLLGSPEIITSQDANDIFKGQEELYQSLGLDIFSFPNAWNSVHFHDLVESHPKKATPAHHKAIQSALKIYKSQKLPAPKFLTDLLDFRTTANITSWTVIQKTGISSVPERGLSLGEKQFADTLSLLKNVSATDIIQEAHYAHRDDSLFECSFLLNELRNYQTSTDCLTIVNPSPSFLNAFNDPKFDRLRTPVVFIVHDETVRDLYRAQFVHFHFYSSRELKEKIPDRRTNLLVVMSRDLDPKAFSEVFDSCAAGANIIAMVAQRDFTAKKNNLFNYLHNKDLHVHKVISVPDELVNSKPRKKMVVYAKKGRDIDCDTARLIFTNLDESKQCLFSERKVYQVPSVWLTRKTLVQIRDELSSTPDINTRNNAKVINFSKEIQIHYVPLVRQNQRHSARAVYRAILRDKEYRKFGKSLTAPTEKGLLSDSKDDVLRKLTEVVPFYDDFSLAICNDILDYFQANCPNSKPLDGVTLKTLWFCCRSSLMQRVTYNDNLCRDLFCGNNQALSNLIIKDIRPEDISVAMDQLITENHLPASSCWFQVKSVMNTAMVCDYISYNPVEYCAEIAIQNSNKALVNIRKNLSKHSFTDNEEERMVTFLCKKDDLHSVCRCVKESIWLIGLIRLFTGLAVREACALQWKHFQQIASLDAYQFVITQQLNSDDQLQSLALYYNRKKLRKVPLVPLLSQILLERLHYLQTFYGYTLEEILEQPIILQIEPKRTARRKRKFSFCSRDVASKISRKILKEANIAEDILSMMDGNNHLTTNLSTTSRDLFYSNFKYRATICGLTEGQLCYIIGTTPSDTLSAHYIDFSNNLVQYDTIRRLCRWANKYAEQVDTIHLTAYESQAINLESIDKAYSNSRNIASLHMDLIPTSKEFGEITIQAESQFGVHGSITVYKKEANRHV